MFSRCVFNRIQLRVYNLNVSRRKKTHFLLKKNENEKKKDSIAPCQHSVPFVHEPHDNAFSDVCKEDRFHDTEFNVWVIKPRYKNEFMSIYDESKNQRSILAFERQESAQHIMVLHRDVLQSYDHKQKYKKARLPLETYPISFMFLYTLCDCFALNILYFDDKLQEHKIYFSAYPYAHILHSWNNIAFKKT